MTDSVNYVAMYKPIADVSAIRNGIPVDLFSRLITSESSWNPGAIGPVISGGMDKGYSALGLAQFTPSTLKDYPHNPLDPGATLGAAAQMLSDRFKRLGSWDMAVASYKGYSDLGLGASSDSVQAVVNGSGSKSLAETIAELNNTKEMTNSKPAVPSESDASARKGKMLWEWTGDDWSSFFKTGAVGAILLTVGVLLVIFSIYATIMRGKKAAVGYAPELTPIIKGGK